MSSYRWRPAEEHLLKLLLPTNTYREISEQLNRRHDQGIAGFPSERSEEAVRKKCDRESWSKETLEAYTEDENPYEDRWKQISEIQSKYAEQSVMSRVGCMPPEKAQTKILALSDIHLPLANEKLLREAIDDNDDADIVVVNGDLLEGFMWSTFAKSRNIAAVDEYMAGLNLVRELSERFPKVVLVEGNHDVRPARQLAAAGFTKDTAQVLRPNIMARIANGEVLDKTGMLVEKLDFSNVYYEPRESWYVKIGKTLFIHPFGRGSSKPGFTVTNMGTKLLARYPKDEVDSIVCGHTHQIYKGVVNGVLMIEQGCLAGLLAYLHKPNNYSPKNYMNGYAVIYQDEDGNTDFNKSGPRYLGEVFPPKKEMAL